MTSSPGWSFFELAVGTTALARLPLPTMALNPGVKDLFAFRFEDFELRGYQSHPHIPAPIAV